MKKHIPCQHCGRGIELSILGYRTMDIKIHSLELDWKCAYCGKWSKAIQPKPK